MNARAPCALVMAGGTGGHIFPGLAVAQELRERGWRVHWLGNAASMEARLVPPWGFALETIDFGGVRGKGWRTLLALPWRLTRALVQSLAIMRRVRPDVLVGMGGYICIPGALAGWLLRRPLLLHEQNAVAGLSNRVLAHLARRVFTAFPEVLPGALWVGNPLRSEFLIQAPPQVRWHSRSGPLRVLVLGGSLGASALNRIVPQALARIPPEQRPQVTHQSGERHLDELRGHYAQAGVQAQLVPFIDNTAAAMAQADLVICRAGASTVTEVAAVGAPALFVPFPAAVDDHQSANARFLVDAGAAWCQPQKALDAEWLAQTLQNMKRETLMVRGLEAKKLQKTGATLALVTACEEVRA